jgi:hypothetical protein
VPTQSGSTAAWIDHDVQVAEKLPASWSSDHGKLAGSLATVAIGSLGGPLTAAGAALTEVVKHLQARHEANAPIRALRTQVESDITEWGKRQRFLSEDVEHGLEIATQSVARFGLDVDAIAALQFDPEKVSRRVQEAAQAHDSYWGRAGQREDKYEVAERAIRVTYSGLIRQFKVSEPLLLPAIQALRGSIDGYVAQAEALGRSAQAALDLTAAEVAAGTTAEVMSYLRSRIADWDVSPWHPNRDAQSAVERRIRLRTTARDASVADEEMTAQEALAEQRMLVVLGGPGSGKSWLARRYAREAAQAALSQLETGAGVDEVELPLLTTWDLWTRFDGEPRESLVAASFQSRLGHSDLGGNNAKRQLQRTFLEPSTRVLMIVDSLDEAADLAGQFERLNALRSLNGWRVVVTSRPAAWIATYRGEPGQRNGPRVVEIQDLQYPEEVDSFIEAWFEKDPSRGSGLIQQIAERDDLARAAVVPLILTFYCLLTEAPAATHRPLPGRRRDLYRGLAKRLLRGKWATTHPGLDAAPDFDYCETVLTDWAWHAIHRRITSTGLGDWGDSFTQPRPPRESARRAIDHVAPKLAEDEEGEITRRFVHRTFLEHFVAEHIAALDTSEAASLLLPHLWFDWDWTVAAPAAIAAHNQRHRGALLQKLLDHALGPAADPARQVASREIDRLLLALAQESEPGNWTPEHQDLLHKCRVRNATSRPDLVARSVHWTVSNQWVRTALRDALPHPAPWFFHDQVRLLYALTSTDAERVETRAALLEALSEAEPYVVLDLVKALTALNPTDAERNEARTAVLNSLPTADREGVGYLVSGLSTLGPTDAERDQARTALLNALSTAGPAQFGGLVKALSALSPTDAERRVTRIVLLNSLPTENAWVVAGFVRVLSALDPSDSELRETRTALLNALPKAGHRVADVARVLSTLDPTDAEQGEARIAVLNSLPTAVPAVFGDLLRVLPALDPTDTERRVARTALLKSLPTVRRWIVGDLAGVLSALHATDAERVEVRTALINSLPSPYTTRAGDLVGVLCTLDPTDDERREARTALLDYLPNLPATDEEGLAELVSGLVALNPTDDERREARTALLNSLSTAKAIFVEELVRVLSALDPTDAEWRKARTALLNALPKADPWILRALVRRLSTLDPTDAERGEARTALLNALPTASATYVGDLVRELFALDPTDTEQGAARTALLNALQTAYPGAVHDMVMALRSVTPLQSWLTWLTSSE